MNDKSTGTEFISRLFVILASIVIILAGLRASTGILVPFLLAVFVTILATPPFFWLQKKGIPSILALLIMVVVIMGLAYFSATLLNHSLRDFARKLPEYQMKFSEQSQLFVSWLQSRGVEISDDAYTRYLNPNALFQYTRNFIGAASAIIGQSAIVFMLVIFMLFEAAILPRKIRSLPNLEVKTYRQLERSILEVRNYMGIKLIVSLLTGFLVWVLLTVMGIDYAVLLATIAFIMNFVPNIGSLLAAVPGVALALLDQGLTSFMIVSGGYILVNLSVSTFLEPRFMGRGLGLSTLVVVLSLLFWGWILGPVGMLLSIPLTMAVKIGFESNESTHWIAVLMGGAPGEEVPAPLMDEADRG